MGRGFEFYIIRKEMHDIEKTYVIMGNIFKLVEIECDIKVMQYLLGQTDIRTTMRVYNHVDSERVKREIEKLENLRSKIG